MYKTKSFIILSLMAIFFACNSNTGEKTISKELPDISDASIRIFDPTANLLIDSAANFEVLAAGFSWSEGPVWVDKLNAVLFSDVPENKIYKWSEKDNLTIYLDTAGYSGINKELTNAGPNGLLLDPEGDLLICQHGDRRIALMNSGLDSPKNQFVTISGKFDGKKFNSPNDLALDNMGILYFTDPPYGLPEQTAGEIGVNGVYRVKPNGEVTLLVDSLTRPNGIGLALDQKTLYINNSDPDKAYLYSYEIIDGKLVNGKVLFDSNGLMKTGKGLPDGLKVHSSGNIFATGPGGVLIISPEGKLLATIATGRATANCAFDKGEKYLYMTSTDLLMRVKLK